jgi:CDP-paratose 2-epimerase
MTPSRGSQETNGTFGPPWASRDKERVEIPLAIITGSGGLIGSESVAHFVEAGYDVLGIENDLRAYFFGPEASTAGQSRRLVERYGESFRWLQEDIRDAETIDRIFSEHARDLELVIHTAAQPSHDWAASEPHTDFSVNANGTLNLLEATRRHKPDATFIFCSTNKVYGDRPNSLPLLELETRLELPEDHDYFDGIPVSMSIDGCLHSLFGASKAAADLLVQEYGRYFDMPTVCFRGGCLTGPNHAGAQLHGFLAYLMRCTVTGTPYTVFGYDGKQVRDNIHSADLVCAFAAFHEKPKAAAVYNIGGGRESNCSMLEAIAACERISGRSLEWALGDAPRIGDHRWWVSDLSAFQDDFPDWELRFGVEEILRAIYEANVETWSVAA